MAQPFESIAFRDPARARRNLDLLNKKLPERLHEILVPLLKQSADPDAALQYLEGFLGRLSESPDSFFRENNRLPALLTVLAHSPFLGETLFRYPELLEWSLDPDRLYQVISTEEMRSVLGWLPADASDEEAAATLARFKKMNLLRIALRDLLGLATLAEVTLELSNLADALLRGAQEHIHQQLAGRFGRPLAQADEGPIESHFVVLALGKLGGRELNYSSDIDLMYLYTDDGQTAGPIRISNREFFTETAQRLTKMLSQITPEGSCYRVDLRLRPEGTMGELALSLGAAVKYYHTRGRDWELQMLIKARPAAGHRPLGETFLNVVEPLIYQTTTDFSTIERVAETRDRISQKLSRKRDAAVNVKLSRGGIRDIEFLVQCLQRLYGGQEPWVRSEGTLFSLHRLRDKGFLSPQDYSRLTSAYTFLRGLEHRLQMEHNRQTHTLPKDGHALEVLTRKMYGGGAQVPAGGLIKDVRKHLKRVTEIYERVIGGQQPLAPAAKKTARMEKKGAAPPRRAGRGEHEPDPNWQALLRHLGKEFPNLASTVNSLTLRWGRKHFEHFLNKIVASGELVSQFEASPKLIACVADLMEHSSYLAEQLIRDPEDALELRSLVEDEAEAKKKGEKAGGPEGEAEPYPDVAEFAGAESDLGQMTSCLRRFYRRKMLGILAESIYGRHPIFQTLEKTSRLADWTIQAALEIGIREVSRTSGKKRPEVSLQVVALGRLGMREFDLGSDADLVFVLPDEASQQRQWWLQVVEHVIDITSSYTREGVLFTIDTRLRPMGRDGELIQTQTRYKEYFASQAEPWEAITYMKARAIAGDIEQATGFLSQLQDVDWRRYGMSENLAGKLVEMRNRLERAHGRSSPIKAGAGGYYDIDFILLYLRLREAGIFFQSLNTPERIAVLRTTKAVSPDQAKALERAAVFFRSLDHALRVLSGPSSSKMPSSVSQKEIAAELLSRWSPWKPAAHELEAALDEARSQTRGLFREIFLGEAQPAEQQASESRDGKG